MKRFKKEHLISAAFVWLVMWAVTLAGCATLGKDECLNADWQSIGYEDGSRGYKASRIGSHRKACAKHGVTPDFDRYEAGRQKGLEEWCTSRNGYQQGLRGSVYNGVCVGPLEQAFMKGFAYGKDVHASASEYGRQKNALKTRYADLDALEMELQALEDELVRSGTSPRRRRQLLEEIRHMEADRQMALNDIADMEHTLEDMQEHLDQLKQNHPYQ